MAKKKRKKNRKIVRYRKPWNINIGMIIFALIFVYMAVYVYTYIRRDKVQFYEVTEGSIVKDRSFRGVILREETDQTAGQAGHISYYVPEGKRASVGMRVYSIDETGSMADFLAANPDFDKSLSGENLSDLKKQLSSYNVTYADERFETAYDIKNTLDAAVLSYVNFNALDNLDSMMEQTGVNFVQVRADRAGVISYNTDSYDSLDVSQISEDVFHQVGYEKRDINSSDLVNSGEVVYKVVTSDLWSVVFPLSEEEAAEYGSKTRLKVSLRGSRGKQVATGDFSIITGADGKPYGKLDFDKYMAQFVSERFVDFEVMAEDVGGLKIPVSAVTEKDFYLIPLDYMAQGGDSSEIGFMREEYVEGETRVVFVLAEIYYSTDEYYYVDKGENSPFKDGDYLVKENSTDRYRIGPSESRKGVYNINKGYAVFKQIEILAEDSEFVTVQKSMRYGLSVYDHIVLKPDSVVEGKPIYQ